jgi:uncharacterized protein YndB with AHSA1/START domain
MSTVTEPTTQVYRVYIRTTPQAVWDAITTPEWTARYGYGGVADFELRPGGRALSRKGPAMAAFPDVPDVIVDGEVLELDPPHRLVQTWRMLMDPAMAAEGFTRLTYEIAETGDGVTRLTVTHELEHAPTVAAMVAGRDEAQGAGGGWAWVLSDLKSLLESGAPMAG